MLPQNQTSTKRRTAAQRASDANRVNQMQNNNRMGIKTPPPRDPAAARAAYEARHNTSSHRR